jgi:4-amino-4-deoxy-L-arabinose transferase-like glycosyltransferase
VIERRVSAGPLPPILAIGAAAGLYLWRLGSTPMFVGGDEAYFALNAHSIAATGRDLSGRLFPLFFNIDLHTWYQPLLVYLMAPVVKVLGVSEWSIRLPTAMIGIADVVLVFGIGRRMFKSGAYGGLAAGMLALTPAHLIVARQAVDYVCPVPFVLGWLWCLLIAIEARGVKASAFAGLLLGLGFYSYIAAWIIMPALLAVGLIAMIASQRQPTAMCAAMIGGFVIPLLLLIAWTQVHPGMIGTMLVRYRLTDAANPSLYQSVRSLLHPYVLEARLSLYWRYFDPVYLFFAGSPDATLSTKKVGVFLWPMAPLLAAGIYDIVRRKDESIILLAGLMLAPVAPVLIDTGDAVQREIPLVAFGALIAVAGTRRLLQSGRRSVRAATVVLVVSVAIQGALFAQDYFAGYRFRSADRLDPVNFGDVARFVIAADASARLPRVYLSEGLDDATARWRFQLAKFEREDLWQRTWIVDKEVANEWSVLTPLPTQPFDARRLPAGALLLLYVNDPAIGRLTADPCCEIARTVPGANGSPVSVILRKRD